MGGQLKLAGLDDAQLKEAAAAALVPTSLSTWLYGIHYDPATFEAELGRAATHMSEVMTGSHS